MFACNDIAGLVHSAFKFQSFAAKKEATIEIAA